MPALPPRAEQPPAILIAWSESDQAWLGTPLDLGNATDAVYSGAGTADGATPDALFDKALSLGPDFHPTRATVRVERTYRRNR